MVLIRISSQRLKLIRRFTYADWISLVADFNVALRARTTLATSVELDGVLGVVSVGADLFQHYWQLI